MSCVLVIVVVVVVVVVIARDYLYLFVSFSPKLHFRVWTRSTV